MTCKSCNGSGWRFYDEDVCGDGGPRMDCSELCPDCLEQSNCPVCGEMVTWYDEPRTTWATCVCGYDSEVAFTAGPIEPEEAAEDAHIRDLATRLAGVSFLGKEAR